MAVVVWGGFVLLTAMTKYVSLGSMWAGSPASPVIGVGAAIHDPVCLVFALLVGGLIVWQHRSQYPAA